jgi:serine phosphatase RsbU (regulator of sigma subunit)
VSGHNPPAAAIIGPVCAVLRGYAIEDPDPAGVLTRLNRYLAVTHRDGDIFLTAVVALYEPDRHALRLANAGHPRPLLVIPDRSGPRTATEPVTRPGPALGVFRYADFDEHRPTLPPGAALCVYTDGVIDRHGNPQLAGEQRLAQIAAEAVAAAAHRATAAHHLVEEILSRMLGGAALDDDACLAILRAPA